MRKGRREYLLNFSRRNYYSLWHVILYTNIGQAGMIELAEITKQKKDRLVI